MSNTSTIHIKTDFDCKVYDYGQELGTTKADTYFNIELRKGEHELTFVFAEDESVSKNVNYIVEDADCDYRLIVEIKEIICDKAKEQYDSGNYTFAFSLFQRCAEKGVIEAQNFLGVCFLYGYGVNQNYSKAWHWLKKSAEQGNADAQFNLYCFDDGHVQTFDEFIEGIKWLTKAAEQGHIKAQLCLGYLTRGNMVNGITDPIKSLEWFAKAAEQGNEEAQQELINSYYDLGDCYEDGRWVDKDFDKAVEWYTKAADLGHPNAKKRLGCIWHEKYYEEDNVNYLFKAIEWWTKAAEQDTITKTDLMLLYEELEYYCKIEKDHTNVEEWLKKAAEQGNEEAKNALNRLKSIKSEPIHYLFFDTETAGLPKDYNALTHWLKNWPRLVQLSWITTDEDCNILSENDYIIYPDGFTIPEDAVRLHGITTEFAKEKGKPIKEVIDKFMEDFNAATTIVGHNNDFDKKIIGAELIRLGQNDIMSSKEALCTMKGSVDYCKIPSSHGYKWPKLQELHKKLFGFEFEDAHNSLSDVKATLKCFKEMKKLGWI